MPVLDGYELPLFERIFPSPGTVFNEEELCRPAAMLPEHQLSEFAESIRQLDQELKAAKERKALSLIEVKCAIGAREDLGRPTTTARENKENFMAFLKNE